MKRASAEEAELLAKIGVTARAALDDDSGFWPTSYALTDPTEQAWEQLGEVVRRAAGAKQ